MENLISFGEQTSKSVVSIDRFPIGAATAVADGIGFYCCCSSNNIIPVTSYIFRNSLKLKANYAEMVASLQDASEKFILLIPFLESNRDSEIVHSELEDKRLGIPLTSRVLADKVPPTANVSAATSLIRVSNVYVQITFNKPCTGGGGFRNQAMSFWLSLTHWPACHFANLSTWICLKHLLHLRLQVILALNYLRVQQHSVKDVCDS